MIRLIGEGLHKNKSKEFTQKDEVKSKCWKCWECWNEN